jgi:hypothetical protein
MVATQDIEATGLGQACPFGGLITFEPIGYRHSRDVLRALEQLTEEFLRGLLVAPALHGVGSVRRMGRPSGVHEEGRWAQPTPLSSRPATASPGVITA